MNNVLILGCGRSGTSMVAGMFQNSGAYFGDRLIAATAANPLGYFECHDMNQLNDRLIQHSLYGHMPKLLARLTRKLQPPVHRDPRSLWLGAPRWLRSVPLPDPLLAKMQYFISHTPFCFKDPRFSITLPFWSAVLPANVRYLVVFRDPYKTVDSMLKISRELYDPPLPLDERWAWVSWYRTYRRLLNTWSTQDDRWMFIWYDQIATGEAVPALERFVATPLATEQIDPRLSRSQAQPPKSNSRLQHQCAQLFAELQHRANQDMKR